MVEFYRTTKVLQAGFAGQGRLPCELTLGPAQKEEDLVGEDFLKDKFIT